ncbi:hypothetical protein KI686_16365, partial [Polaribacter sp. DS7-9]|nr:hypothetical protein [Polaribacter sp. DS7-9]
VLATLMLGLFSALPDEQFLAWGWRVPFLFSALLVIVGLVIRLKVSETPNFRRLAAQAESRRSRVPIVEVIRHHWRAVLLSLAAVLAFTTSQGLMTVWGV